MVQIESCQDHEHLIGLEVHDFCVGEKNDGDANSEERIVTWFYLEDPS